MASDIHLEFQDWEPPVVDADVLVLAGDIGVGLQGIEAAMKWADRYQYGCIYVNGNHEFYKGIWPDLINAQKLATGNSNVHVLDNESIVLGGVRFCGATLWTDFNLYGPAEMANCRLVAQRNMSDYYQIKKSYTGNLKATDTQAAHHDSVKWLRRELANSTSGQKTVVITHHAPSERSVHPRFRQRKDKLTPAFTSNLEGLMDIALIDTWLCGHTHFNTQYEVNGTRVLSNCRGYPGEEVEGFNPGLVVQI